MPSKTYMKNVMPHAFQKQIITLLQREIISEDRIPSVFDW